MKKSNGGFSLIELIVVIAIMAILAGVSIPTYVNYIAKANDAAALEELNEIKTAAIAQGAELGKSVSSIEVTGASVSIYYSGEATAASETTWESYAENEGNLSALLSNSKSYQSGATWTSSAGWSAK